jgi:dolichol-phosphate mannosyltransferase
MTPKVLVVPVAYNEKIKLGNVIGRFLQSQMALQADYLIVDDGSHDGTTEMIASYKDRGVMSVKHPRRRGVGAAIRTGIEYATNHGYDIVVIMAGNDKDDPEEIPQLLRPILCEGYDLVQGSRYLGKIGSVGQMPFYRKFATRLHPLVFSLFSGRHLTDTTNGFRAIRLGIFRDERINLNQEWLDAYELEPYLLWKVITLGYKFKETFVTKIYPSKEMGGHTKMIPFVSWWSILRPLFYLRWGIKK